MTTTAQTDKPLTYSEHKLLKAVVRRKISMALTEPGTWRDHTSRTPRPVTSAVRRLIDRGILAADQPYINGTRSCRITREGYEALSRATSKPPTKRAR